MGAPPLVRPLLRRDFRLLWIGAAASLLGDGAYLVALAWQAYSLTREPAGLAVLGVCATVPQLLALVAGGVVSDRFDRRLVLLAADVTRVIAVGAVAEQRGGGPDPEEPEVATQQGPDELGCPHHSFARRTSNRSVSLVSVWQSASISSSPFAAVTWMRKPTSLRGTRG